MNLIDKHGLLEPEQTDVLSNRVIANFTLGKYNSLDEILTNLGVNVIIEPGTVTRSIPSELEEAEKYSVEIEVKSVYDSIESLLSESYGLSEADVEEINSIKKDRDYTIRLMEIVGTLES